MWGNRLRAEALGVQVGGSTITQATALSVAEASNTWFCSLLLRVQVGLACLRHAQGRGLGYGAPADLHPERLSPRRFPSHAEQGRWLRNRW